MRLLLGPGTLIPVAVTALAGWFLLGLPPAAAILLGAALASTDAVLLPAKAQVALRLETGMNGGRTVETIHACAPTACPEKYPPRQTAAVWV